MNEEFWDDLIGLLLAARADAVMRSRKDEVEIEEFDKRIEQAKKLKLDSQVTVVKEVRTL